MGKRRLAKAPSVKEKRRAKSRWTTWVLIGAAAVVIGLMIALVMWQSGGKDVPGAGQVGKPAPDFTLRLLSGESATLSSLKGRPILVNFWASG